MLREYAAKRGGAALGLKPTTPAGAMSDVGKFLTLSEALPLGALSGLKQPLPSRWSERKALMVQEVAEGFLRAAREVEPEAAEAWGAQAGRAVLEEVAGRLVEHHDRMLLIMREMYRDSKFKLSDVAYDLSFFRSKPYLDRLEAEMASLVQWVDATAAPSEPATSGGFGGKGGKGGKSKKEPPKTSSSKGFGR
jgi:hypothetical protein